MTLSTKFSIGDKVFVIRYTSDGLEAITEREVSAVASSCDERGVRVVYHFQPLEGDPPGLDYPVRELQVHGTFQEAADELRRNADKKIAEIKIALESEINRHPTKEALIASL